MNTAIIAAAGSGTRTNSPVPKQFLEILGKPLLVHTIERFEMCPAIDEIILVLASGEIEGFGQILEKYGLAKVRKIVAGGETRAGSVRNGLDAVSGSAGDVVAVHDGARPLVSIEEIAQTVEKASEMGAACLVAPVTDTIKEVADWRIIGTIDRGKLRRALTPQAFRYEILQKAFAQGGIGAEVTDECYLVEKLGQRIAFVEGSARNIKVTHPEDVLLAELFLRNE
jgi:2-C-methyl-D-erythritol 4-phosphate cytidylyltransferase